MNIIKYPTKEAWKSLMIRPSFPKADIEKKVKLILEEVKINGDKAVKDFTFKYDQVVLETIRVDEETKRKAEKKLNNQLIEAIKLAKNNIYKFHNSQKTVLQKIETSKGIQCWQKSIPIEKVGLYIPGGTAPLLSTVLMLAIPAKIAGCNEVILCSPPDKNGNIHPAILYAANICGVNKIYKAGGAQAIAAMAYGTNEIPSVYKIFGPGNQFVTIAKQMISIEGIAIDMPAGPSELLVVADKNANADFVAADLLSQAEHGTDSQVIFITNNETLLQNVLKALNFQLQDLPRKIIAKECLKNSYAIIVNSIDEAIDFSNAYAPEHLILNIDDFEKQSERITHAGSVFLGKYSCESAGDYASGTNHTLPTNGYCRSSGGVNLDSFYKKVTFQQITKEGLEAIAPSIEVLANAENLYAHKNAVTIRLK